MSKVSAEPKVLQFLESGRHLEARLKEKAEGSITSLTWGKLGAPGLDLSEAEILAVH